MPKQQLISRGLPSLLEKDLAAAKDLGIHLYPKAAELGLGGFHQYSQQEKDIIVEQEYTEHLFKQMKSEVTKFVPMINELFGENIVVIDDSGKVTLRPDLQTPEGLKTMWEKISQGSITKQSLLRDSMRLRDKHIADTIDRLHSQGYDVFSPYGGSHVITQRPVLDALYGRPRESNY